MQVYRWVWGVLATVVVGPAVVWAVLLGAGVELVVVGSGLALFAGMFMWVIAEDQPARWEWVRRSVLLTVLGAPGADALSTAWGTAGSVLAVVFLASAPAIVEPAHAMYVRWSSSHAGGAPELLSRSDLRSRWDMTTGEMRHPATGVARRLVLLEERRMLLDELQQRDPVHFDAWVVTAVPQDGPTWPGRWTS